MNVEQICWAKVYSSHPHASSKALETLKYSQRERLRELFVVHTYTARISSRTHHRKKLTNTRAQSRWKIERGKSIKRRGNLVFWALMRASSCYHRQSTAGKFSSKNKYFSDFIFLLRALPCSRRVFPARTFNFPSWLRSFSRARPSPCIDMMMWNDEYTIMTHINANLKCEH